MSSLMRLLNRLLPFATPGTPVYQDVIHLGVLALFLYYAPQIQEHLQQRSRTGDEQVDGQSGQEDVPAENDLGREPPQEEIRQGGDDEARQHGGAEAQEEDPMPPLRNAAPEEPAEAGPANAPRVPPQRNIGAKKAKSLARKDQRRAYHEFQRSQAESQRAIENEGAAEREAEQAAQLARRKAAEAKLEEKKAKEREKRREQERKEREEQIASRERVVRLVRDELDTNRMCNLFDVATRIGGDYDEISIEKILNAANVLGTGDGGAMTMVMSTGWVVRVRSEDMAQAYSAVAETCEGDIGYEKLGHALQSILRSSTG
ncbi:hypothetical protein Slin15195_G026810 [Septoria linicola]|uniref:Uncharacterized protein n=1 Tax=Septoria linicola TaxID=215465 RepID=A0A9Q9ANR9_9PEZI|nr:hypothetical protein Slin14017_G025880 [Septoria linicola]USW49362.1 hypothetical protein Slin15195_G026810 [Septoria linicola]